MCMYCVSEIRTWELYLRLAHTAFHASDRHTGSPGLHIATFEPFQPEGWFVLLFIPPHTRADASPTRSSVQ